MLELFDELETREGDYKAASEAKAKLLKLEKENELIMGEKAGLKDEILVLKEKLDLLEAEKSKALKEKSLFKGSSDKLGRSVVALEKENKELKGHVKHVGGEVCWLKKINADAAAVLASGKWSSVSKPPQFDPSAPPKKSVLDLERTTSGIPLSKPSPGAFRQNKPNPTKIAPPLRAPSTTIPLEKP